MPVSNEHPPQGGVTIPPREFTEVPTGQVVRKYTLDAADTLPHVDGDKVDELQGLDGGKPQLDAVDTDLLNEVGGSLTALILRLAEEIAVKQQETQMGVEQNTIQANQQKRLQQNKAQLQELEKMWKKLADAKKAGGIARKLGLFGKIVGFVAALAAVVACLAATGLTAGAATPLLALSVMALAGATISLGSAISEESGGASWSVSENVYEKMGNCKALGNFLIVLDPSIAGKMASDLAEYSGGDEDWQMAFNIIGTVVAVAAMTMAGMAAAAKAASAATKVADSAGKTAELAGKATQAKHMAMAGQAGVGIVSGVNSGVTATYTYEQATLEARGQESGIAREVLQKALEALADADKDAMKMLEQLMAAMATLMGDISEFLKKEAAALRVATNGMPSQAV